MSHPVSFWLVSSEVKKNLIKKKKPFYLSLWQLSSLAEANILRGRYKVMKNRICASFWIIIWIFYEAWLQNGHIWMGSDTTGCLQIRFDVYYSSWIRYYDLSFPYLAAQCITYVIDVCECTFGSVTTNSA